MTRNAPLETPRFYGAMVVPVQPDYSVDGVRFAVPVDLSVSEADSYYPVADIVWRGDPLGNRPAQIANIFQTAIQSAGAGLTGSVPVIVDVKLIRFHSLTDRSRYAFGGVHNIEFDLTIRDALSGAVLEPTRRVETDLEALGGREAMAADGAGQTQKVRVTNHLTEFFFRELGGEATPFDARSITSS